LKPGQIFSISRLLDASQASYTNSPFKEERTSITSCIAEIEEDLGTLGYSSQDLEDITRELLLLKRHVKLLESSKSIQTGDNYLLEVERLMEENRQLELELALTNPEDEWEF